MYIISSMEVLISLSVIHQYGLSLHWPGFSSHRFVKGCLSANKMLVPLCMVRTQRIHNSNLKNPIPTHFTLFGVLWAPQSSERGTKMNAHCLGLQPSARGWHGTSWESRRSLFIHADSYYGMFIQVMKGPGIIGAKESPRWYLVLTKYVANETQVKG